MSQESSTTAFQSPIETIPTLQEQTNTNMAQEADTTSVDALSLGVHETKNGRLKLSVIAPTLQKGMKRLPVKLCCVVDTSGSMQLSAKIKDNAGREESLGITVLQLVKHSIKTIIHCLDKQDYLSIVAYSSKAKVVTKLERMTEQNKSKALAELDKLRPAGQTNLWDGLKNGLDMIRSNKLNPLVRPFDPPSPAHAPPSNGVRRRIGQRGGRSRSRGPLRGRGRGRGTQRRRRSAPRRAIPRRNNASVTDAESSTASAADTKPPKQIESAAVSSNENTSANYPNGARPESNVSVKNCAVLLFTDGLPNVTPPKGELGMFDKYVDTYGLPAAIYTYGFGMF